MLDPEIARGGNGVGGFVVWIARRADCEGADIASQFGDGPANQAGIDAAREQSSHRNIGLETELHRVQEDALGLVYCFFERNWAVLASLGGLPVGTTVLATI